MKKVKDLNSTVKAALDDSIDDLPDELSSKLAQIRQEALKPQDRASLNKPAPSFLNKEWMAIAACISLIIPIWIMNTPNLDEPLEVQSIDLMVSFAQLDEVEWELVDDLEFALWLSEQSQLEGGVKPG